MLDPDNRTVARLPSDKGPYLIVVVDTEEEFDWSQPFSRSETAVTAMRGQEKAHRIFEKYAIRPTYLIDYPVASQPAGYQPLKDLLDDGLCTIGAHLHPWVNPPFLEEVNRRNSYPGNLEPELELEKLRYLADTIEENLEVRPTIYKAGRYGVGANTAAALSTCGFEIDMSVVPRSDFSDHDGPDFSDCGTMPYWFGPGGGLLEIPFSVVFCGLLSGFGNTLHGYATSQRGRALRLKGILARLRLFERIRLTPEGITHLEHRRMTKKLLGAGQQIFTFTYHSPSLAVGNTPYVQSETELGDFLGRFERYFDYFINELGGSSATPEEIRGFLLPLSGDQSGGGSTSRD